VARNQTRSRESGNSTDQLLDQIREAFPVFAEFLPLAPGIDQELTERYPAVDNWRLIAALRRHRNDVRYLKAQLRCTERYSLFGDPVGEITESERAHVSRCLRERMQQGESGALGEDPLDDMKDGQRLMLVKQASYRFGPEVSRRARPMLAEVGEEKALEELGQALIEAFTPEDWLEALEQRLPYPDGGPA
jgi:ProP effector